MLNYHINTTLVNNLYYKVVKMEHTHSNKFKVIFLSKMVKSFNTLH